MALSKALKKWLLILRSENVLVNGSLLKEKALEFANEINIEGFQASEGWLKNEKKMYLHLDFYSANKGNPQRTFISNALPVLTAFPSTLTLQCSFSALRK